MKASKRSSARIIFVHTAKALCGGFLSAVLCLFLESPAYAVGTPMGDVLCQVIGWMLGTLGYGLATIGVTIGGVGACFGKISWGLALTIMVGVIVLFGATGILYDLLGKDQNGNAILVVCP